MAATSAVASCESRAPAGGGRRSKRNTMPNPPMSKTNVTNRAAAALGLSPGLVRSFSSTRPKLSRVFGVPLVQVIVPGT